MAVGRLTFKRRIPGEPAEFWVACSDETTAIASGTAKITFRAPHEISLEEIRASLTSAATTGTFTVDVNVNGSSILSTKLTIDAGEKTSVTAAAPAVLTTQRINDDAEISVDVDDDADGTATGLKVVFNGYR